ncbi:MAG: hypothetical protein U0175_14875 [Caldilineaceae bacterium]
MTQLTLHPAGGYHYLPHRIAFGDGVVAAAGFEIVHAAFFKPLPFAQGFDAAVAYLKSIGRPVDALCGAELRSPKPFTNAGFAEFNNSYVAKLDAMGVRMDGVTPMTRSNVAPVSTPPNEVALYAFSYTLPSVRTQKTFVVSGAADVDDQGPVAAGDTSAEGLRTKARFVWNELAAAMQNLGVDAATVTATNFYTAEPMHVNLLKIMHCEGLHGARWYYSLPPIEGLSFEVDVRCTYREEWL